MISCAPRTTATPTDAHYLGGCLLLDNLVWGSTLLTLAAQPPDPRLVGRSWRRTWRRRLAAARPYAETWLRHPRRDDYWRRGSVGEDPGALACPVFLVGGWADGYTDAVPRLLAGLQVPRRAWVGPWGHVYPHNGVPGPAVGFLQEALGWWRRWLGQPGAAGPDDVPVRLWLPSAAPPDASAAERPGRWLGEEGWPPAGIVRRDWRLAPGRLFPADGAGVEGATAETALAHVSPASVGATGGAWCPFGADGELPGDQRPDDARSLLFDSAPLAAPIELLGAVEVALELAVDRPLAQLAVRLCAVAPDGSSARLAYGVLDLTHRDGHERPEPLVPGRRLRVRLALGQTAAQVPAGDRLRLALSTGYWPQVWPAPWPVRLTVFPAASRLAMPLRPPRWEAALRPLPPPETAGGPAVTDLDPETSHRSVRRDGHGGLVHRVVTGADRAGDGVAMSRLDGHGLEVGHGVWETYRIRDDDPLSADAEVVQRTVLRRRGWEVRTETRSRLTADAASFRLRSELRAEEAGGEVVERRWESRVPRDLAG